jgi:hypothetical protein
MTNPTAIRHAGALLAALGDDDAAVPVRTSAPHDSGVAKHP